jgi:hypothetical protein
LLSRLEQGAGTAPISPQIAEKLLDRMDEPSTQELVESVKSYDEVSRKIDSFAVLVASYRARMNHQDRTLQFTAAAPASKGDVLVTVWIESDGDVLERQNRPDQPSLWFQWHAPATVINTLQMMVHDPVFGDLHRKNARTADSDRVNAAACVRFRWVGGDSGYLNDRQARMLTFVLDAARSASVVQSVASNATGVNACTPDVSNIGMQKVTF